MNYTVHGILQARILEWVAFPFSRDLSNPGIEPRSSTLRADSLPAEPPGKPKDAGGGGLSLLQGIFPTQEPSQALLHCRRILGSPESRASCLASCTSSVFARTGHVVARLGYFTFTNSQLIRHLSCSHFFTIVYNAAMSIPGQVFLRMYVFTSLRCVPRRGTAGSQGNPV